MGEEEKVEPFSKKVSLIISMWLGEGERIAEGDDDDDNKLKMVAYVFGREFREFRLLTYWIFLILFLASCFLFIILGCYFFPDCCSLG